jgi:NADH-quinone oxidoreductase subunit J
LSLGSFIAFCGLSVPVILGALTVILAQNPVTCALALIISLFGVAGLFALAGGGFLAVVQVLIYAGAVVTLFVFVVMLLNLHSSELDESGLSRQKVLALVAAAFLLGSLIAVDAADLVQIVPKTSIEQFTVKTVAYSIFTRYVFAFELTSVLLLAAVIGVVALARRESTP